MFTRSGCNLDPAGAQARRREANGQADFGGGVALSADGSTALIGGWNDGQEYGAAWVFTRSGSTWTQQGPKITAARVEGRPFIGKASRCPPTATPRSSRGRGTTASRSGVGVHALGLHVDPAGAKLKGGGEIGEGFFGESVSLSADGNTALIGGEWTRQPKIPPARRGVGVHARGLHVDASRAPS